MSSTSTYIHKQKSMKSLVIGASSSVIGSFSQIANITLEDFLSSFSDAIPETSMSSSKDTGQLGGAVKNVYC